MGLQQPSGSSEKILFLRPSIQSPLGLKVEKQKVLSNCCDHIGTLSRSFSPLAGKWGRRGRAWLTRFVWKRAAARGGTGRSAGMARVAPGPAVPRPFPSPGTHRQLCEPGVCEGEDGISRGDAGAERCHREQGD